MTWGGLLSRQPPSGRLLGPTNKPAEAGCRLNSPPHKTKNFKIYSCVARASRRAASTFVFWMHPPMTLRVRQVPDLPSVAPPGVFESVDVLWDYFFSFSESALRAPPRISVIE